MPGRAGCCRSGNGRCRSRDACPRNAAPVARFRTRPLLDPLSVVAGNPVLRRAPTIARQRHGRRSEEHTSELQSRLHLVCRLLLEKKKKTHIQIQFERKNEKKKK